MQREFIVNKNWLMLYREIREIIALCSEKHSKSINTLAYMDKMQSYQKVQNVVHVVSAVL
jgi:deoxyribose-phosphate aldolase